jgi:hypothetical protein
LDVGRERRAESGSWGPLLEGLVEDEEEEDADEEADEDEEGEGEGMEGIIDAAFERSYTRLYSSPGLFSPHLKNQILHIHRLYISSQSLHVTKGEYKSRPQAWVRRVTLKLVREEMRGWVILSGRLVEV